MALRSVLDVEVNDQQFKRYKALFDKYQEQVKQLPKDFELSAKAIDGSRESFQQMLRGLQAQNYETKLFASMQKQVEGSADRQAHHWRGISRFAKSTAGHVSSITLNLLKWAGALGGLGGALGLGGLLFGLPRLSSDVSGARRSSMGLGINYGQQSAFGLNFGRFVNAGSVLGNVSSSLYNATSPGYVGLLSAGLSQGYLSTHNAADVSASLLEKLPGLFGKTPKNLIGARAHAMGLDNLIGTEDIIRYLNASPAERDKQIKNYRRDAGGLDVDSKTQRAYADFTTQLERAGKGIENTFIKGLAPLTGPLEHLSQSVEKLISSFLGSDALKHGLETLSGGIERFSKYITSPEFEQGIKSFVDGVESMGRKIVNILRLLGIVPDPGAQSDGANANGVSDTSPNRFLRRPHRGGRSQSGTHGNDARDPGGRFWWENGANGGPANNVGIPREGGQAPTNAEGTAMRSMMDQLRSEGVPEDHVRAAAAVMVGQATAESRLNPNATHDRDPATGQPTGFGIYGARHGRATNMAAWLRENGFARNSLEGQSKYMAHEAMSDPTYARTRRYLMSATRENMAQGAFTATENFERPLVNNWGDRFNHSRRIFQNYQEAGTRPRVEIQNNTGGNTIISTTQAAN